MFQAPSITLAAGLTRGRVDGRNVLLEELDRQRGALEESATLQQYDQQRQSAISMLSSPEVRRAFDVTNADAAEQQRYGRNAFGWSLLMALRLVEADVNLIQVNLGNNETWDNHGEIFWRLKEKLFPPLDRALSAFLDDLESRGLLDSTLIVMASEFGRTPKLSTLSTSYNEAGRDHWERCRVCFFAGGGIKGGQVIGASDKIGGYPVRDPQTPENMAATIYRQLGSRKPPPGMMKPGGRFMCTTGCQSWGCFDRSATGHAPARDDSHAGRRSRSCSIIASRSWAATMFVKPACSPVAS